MWNRNHLGQHAITKTILCFHTPFVHWICLTNCGGVTGCTHMAGCTHGCTEQRPTIVSDQSVFGSVCSLQCHYAFTSCSWQPLSHQCKSRSILSDQLFLGAPSFAHIIYPLDLQLYLSTVCPTITSAFRQEPLSSRWSTSWSTTLQTRTMITRLKNPVWTWNTGAVYGSLVEFSTSRTASMGNPCYLCRRLWTTWSRTTFACLSDVHGQRTLAKPESTWYSYRLWEQLTVRLVKDGIKLQQILVQKEVDTWQRTKSSVSGCGKCSTL